METKKRIARAAGKLLRIAGWTAASIAVLLLIVQLVLGPGVLTPLVNKTVSQYIDGNFSTKCTSPCSGIFRPSAPT